MVFAAQEKEVQRLRLVPVCGELQQDQQGEEEIGIRRLFEGTAFFKTQY